MELYKLSVADYSRNSSAINKMLYALSLELTSVASLKWYAFSISDSFSIRSILASYLSTYSTISDGLLRQVSQL